MFQEISYQIASGEFNHPASKQLWPQLCVFNLRYTCNRCGQESNVLNLMININAFVVENKKYCCLYVLDAAFAVSDYQFYVPRNVRQSIIKQGRVFSFMYQREIAVLNLVLVLNAKLYPYH